MSVSCRKLVECGKPLGSGITCIADLEGRRRRRLDGKDTVIAVAPMPRAHTDVVRARGRVDVDEHAAHAQVLLGHRLDLGDEIRSRRDARRSHGKIDLVGGSEIEIDAQERRSSAGNDQMLAIIEPNLEIDDPKRIAVRIDGRCRH